MQKYRWNGCAPKRLWCWNRCNKVIGFGCVDCVYVCIFACFLIQHGPYPGSGQAQPQGAYLTDARCTLSHGSPLQQEEDLWRVDGQQVLLRNKYRWWPFPQLACSQPCRSCCSVWKTKLGDIDSYAQVCGDTSTGMSWWFVVTVSFLAVHRLLSAL